MKERKVKLTPKNVVLYILGFFIIGLGVILLERTRLGVGAWDSTNFNLNLLLNDLFKPSREITFGETSLVISFILFFSVVFYRIKRKEFNINLLIMLIPMFTIAAFINFWDLIVLDNFYTDIAPPLHVGLMLFAVGLIILPLGLVLIIASQFPATVYDEFTIMLTEVFKTEKFGRVRLGFEVSGVVLAIIFTTIGTLTIENHFESYTFLGYVSFGTLAMAITLGPLMNVYMKLFGIQKDDSNG